MTEEQLSEIAAKWEPLKDFPWEDVLYYNVSRQSEGVAVFATYERQDKLRAIESCCADIQALLAEVRFLRSQLSDLCEDSRAVAEVARLRQVLAGIVRHIGFYMDDMVKSGSQLALCKMVLEDMAGLKEIAQRGLAADQDILARRAVDLASFSVRVRKGFKRIGINTVADLLAKREGDLLCEIKNFGRVSLLEVKNALAAHGLKLAE